MVHLFSLTMKLSKMDINYAEKLVPDLVFLLDYAMVFLFFKNRKRYKLILSAILTILSFIN